MEGVVYGYNHDPSKKLLQREKQIKLEGALEGVSLKVFENGRLTSSGRSNSKGEFIIRMNLGKVYKVELSKAGYTKSNLIIDLKSVPSNTTGSGIKFTGSELILNSFQIKDTSIINQPFGKLFYNAKDNFIDFEPNKIKSKGLLSKREEFTTSISLMQRSVLKNKGNIKAVSRIAKSEKIKDVKGKAKTASKDTSSLAHISSFRLTPNRGIQNFTEKEVDIREHEIQQALDQLEQDKLRMLTPEDSVLIKEREDLLNAAIIELENARKMIELQKEQISTQQKLLFLAIGTLVLLLGFLFIIYHHYKEKKKTNILLADKNKKITDSINYASRIQQSILVTDGEIKKHLPNSFVYYEARDIVGGDFYWFSEVNGKIIISAIDCTGHGVPGAFMSLIGNTLLNEIVNEKHITEPALILKSLHTGVVNALHQKAGEAHSQDGMEMSVCVIDKQNKMIEYAGAMSPLYVVENNTVTIIKPDVNSVGGVSMGEGKDKVEDFRTRQVPISENMAIYLFTDGYMDQFGGPENKKFNTSRFKKLLLDIQKNEMAEQKKAVDEAIKKWKGNYRQIDDILVIGIKF